MSKIKYEFDGHWWNGICKNNEMKQDEAYKMSFFEIWAKSGPKKNH